jgi:chemotaxis protein histidine kinase CheA
MLGGNISVQSSPGNGTTVSLQLPAEHHTLDPSVPASAAADG